MLDKSILSRTRSLISRSLARVSVFLNLDSVRCFTKIPSCTKTSLPGPCSCQFGVNLKPKHRRPRRYWTNFIKHGLERKAFIRRKSRGKPDSERMDRKLGFEKAWGSSSDNHSSRKIVANRSSVVENFSWCSMGLRGSRLRGSRFSDMFSKSQPLTSCAGN